MSAFQKNAEPCLQMFTVEDSPSSVAYLPCDTTEQFLTLFSSWLALGPVAASAGVAWIATIAPVSRPAATMAALSLRCTRSSSEGVRGSVGTAELRSQLLGNLTDKCAHDRSDPVRSAQDIGDD